MCHAYEKSRVTAVKMNILRTTGGVQSPEEHRNSITCEMTGVRKYCDQRIQEGVLRWYGHAERMERTRVMKRVRIQEWVSWWEALQAEKV